MRKHSKNCFKKRNETNENLYMIIDVMSFNRGCMSRDPVSPVCVSLCVPSFLLVNFFISHVISLLLLQNTNKLQVFNWVTFCELWDKIFFNCRHNFFFLNADFNFINSQSSFFVALNINSMIYSLVYQKKMYEWISFIYQFNFIRLNII